MSHDAANDDRYQALVQAQGAALRRLAASYEADRGRQEDLWQEICLALWRALPAFRGDCSERTFAFRIAHNRGISHALRHRGPQPVELDELDDEGHGLQLADPAADPERQVAERQTRERLMAAVRALPLVPRQVLTLSLEGLSHREIGEVLGLTDTNVAVRLHRARERVRAALAAPSGFSHPTASDGARP